MISSMMDVDRSSEMCHKVMDEHRAFEKYYPVLKMPKSFLMSGKRRQEVEMFYRQDGREGTGDVGADSSGSESPSIRRDRGSIDMSEDSDDGRHRQSQFSPSAGSAFSKIERPEPDSSLPRHSFASTPTSPSSVPGLYPGMYPSMMPYSFGSIPPETGNSPSHSLGTPCFYPPVPIPSPSGSDRPNSESPNKNMFYYVDPRIPFTNYFLNLTKLLNNNNSINSNANKDSSATAPFVKMADEEESVDDREHPGSPEMQTSAPTPRKSRSDSENSLDMQLSSQTGVADEIEKKPLKIEVAPTKLNMPTFGGHPLMNPFTSPIMHPSHVPAMPLHGGGIFHPAMMQLPGTSYRRYNPEKPPPIKKYKCDVCGKAFSRSNTLVTHKRIHTGDKPFKCEICARAFRQPGNLTRHRLTHTTVKPYVCPTCNKAFNRASNLHTHMRTHTSFKAFICPYCGKGFHQKIDMKIHCYTHTAHGGRTEAARM